MGTARELSNTPKVRRQGARAISKFAPRHSKSDPTGPKWREGCARGLRATVSCETSFENGNRRSFCAVRVIKNDARVWDHLELWRQREQRKLTNWREESTEKEKTRTKRTRTNKKTKKTQPGSSPVFVFSYVSFRFLVFWFVFFCLLGVCFCFALYFLM
jgi:hypothetical protein